MANGRPQPRQVRANLGKYRDYNCEVTSKKACEINAIKVYLVAILIVIVAIETIR